MPFIPGNVEISTPPPGTTVVVGTTFRVAGWTEPCVFFKPGGTIENDIPPSQVAVSLDGGAPQPARALSADWATWGVNLRLTATGQHTVTANANWAAGGCRDASATVTVNVVETPLNLVEPAGPVSTVDFPVAVEANHPNGISGVRVRADGQGWVTLGESGGRWTGRLQLNSDRVPAGGRTVPVDLQATSGDGLIHDRSVQIRAVDATVPVVLDFAPADGAKLPGTAVGTTVEVVVRAQDPGQSQLTSGIAAIEVQVDDGAWTPAQPAADPSTWIGRVFVPGADDHTLNVRARDASGGLSAAVSHGVVVVTPADLPDLSRQTYLDDLLAFTTQRLLTRGIGDAVLPPVVTAGQLGEAVGQDLIGVARMGATEAVAPVRTLRLVVEALSRYMRPAAPAPLAGWPLRDGEGNVAADTGSGLADGDIEGASWVAGEDPPVLRFEPTASAHVRVGAQASAQVRVRDRLTLVARIRPSRDTPEPGIIINKEGEYELARFPDGTLRWALATTSPGWNWIDTGAVAALGQWTHVVVAYDGERVRTWTDGVLRPSAPSTGPIGDVDPGMDELWIGGRPTAPQHFAGDIADVAVFDRALTEYEVHRLLGRSDDEDGTRLWVDDDLPPGAVTELENDAWEWVEDDPAPSSGVRCHRSSASAGRHQHLFTVSESGFPVDRGDVLVTDVWLDPSSPPRQVMLQWRDAEGSWEHRAYWGENLIDWGTNGSDSRRRLGDLPSTGKWVPLRVPARLVGLERGMVHGVAFTLFDGRAAWDRTGRLTATAAAAESGHLAAAYGALLRSHGTSEVELRLSRGTDPPRRAALAERLGFTLGPTRPDELDALLLDRSELTASALAALFGFPDPLGGGAPVGRSLLTQLRLAALRERWRRADHDGTVAATQPPVIDPEVLVADDVIDASSQAARLLDERIEWRTAQLNALSALRGTAANDAAAVATALAQVLGGVDLNALEASRRAGEDISAALAAAALDLRGLVRLLKLRDLADTGPLRDEEWNDLVTVLVRVLRMRNRPTWGDAERANDVVVDPAIFRDSALENAEPLPAFIDTTARQDWLDRLAARALSVEAVTAAEAAATAAADDASLPLLRDALLAALDPGIEGLSVADALTSTLFVDVGAGAQDVTSRVEQAIEAVQGLVLAARTNRLAPQEPWPPAGPSSTWTLRETDDYPRADFDAEWQWMGAYAAWQAAVSVFFRPELMLFPTLRTDATESFVTLVKGLAEEGSDLTPQVARRLAQEYKAQLSEQDKATLQDIDDLILTDQLARADIADLAARQQQLLSQYADLQAVPQVLLEVLWLVPLQAAIALSRAGEHLAAIDWLRTLYAYDQTGDRRIVFHGFRLHATGTPDIARSLNWLLGEELNPHRIAQDRAGAHLRFTLLLLARCLVESADAEFTADTTESRPRARAFYLAAARSLRAPEFDDPAGPSAPRIPANPLLSVLRGRVAANLGKLRRGLTIAGVPRPAPLTQMDADTALVLPSPDGAPLTPPQRPPLPTPYRYATLLARAQQLLASATQVEASYLSALVGADTEGYTEQRASDDLELASARTAMQRSAVDLAEAEVAASRLQVTRADNQLNTLSGWIAGGETEWERQLLDSYQEIAQLRTFVAFADAAATTFSAAASAAGSIAAAPAAFAVGVAAGGRYVASSALAMAEARSQEATTRASYERRLQEWQLQETLARDDKAIANAQVGIMTQRADIAKLEQGIVEMEERHASSAVTYLSGRRLTGEMYAWMAGQLGEVYRYLLRQATSVARLAETQLAFERQQPPPATIKTNYWTAGGDAGGGSREPDRRGLTGSARLLRDLTELDQHAFETNRRKLNLEHVFPLSRTAPEAFADFRRTGVLRFATPMDAFDRRFPGHLLRTIRRVRLSLVALVPAAQGIAATLTCSGQSRVFVGSSGLVRAVTMTRPPETVAYTSPAGATGVFELDPQPELKYWFEDHGVDTTWELRLPKPANQLDFRAIADVLVTVEYTALYDADYARQVQATLPRRLQGTLALSVRDDFPDAWYALAQAEPTDPARVPPVTLPVSTRDFPRNVENVRLDAISLLAIRAGQREEDADELSVEHLHLVRGSRRVEGGAASATRDVISTRVNASSWLALLDPPNTNRDKAPTGDWELALSSEPSTRDALRSGAIDDLALVLSYRADLPAWPT